MYLYYAHKRVSFGGKQIGGIPDDGAGIPGWKRIFWGWKLVLEGLFRPHQYAQSLHFPPKRGAADTQKPGGLGA
ncbi:hypothetical protein CLOSTASPAR_04143, partial [[Clostridium] asparagiforme DSM 15981]